MRGENRMYRFSGYSMISWQPEIQKQESAVLKIGASVITHCHEIQRYCQSRMGMLRCLQEVNPLLVLRIYDP